MKKLAVLLFVLIPSFLFSQFDHLENEVINKRTEKSRHFENEDGTLSAYISPTPLNYLKNDTWEPININISENVENDVFPFSNIENTVKTYYPDKYLRSGIKIQSKDFELTEMLEPGMYIDHQKRGFLSDRISVDQNRITYRSILPYLDMEIRQIQSGKKVNYIIHSNEFFKKVKNDQLVFEEKIQIPDNWHIELIDNTINIYDESGTWIVHYAAPYCFDSKIEDEDNDFLRGEYANIHKDENGLYVIKMSFETDWFLRNDRNYPVTIDPTGYYYPNNSLYYTGRQVNMSSKSSGYMRITDANSTSWAMFDLSGLNLASIKDVDLFSYHYVNTSGSKLVKVKRMGTYTNPVSATSMQIWNSITNASDYVTNYEWGGTQIGWRNTDLGNHADIDVANQALSPGYLALGFMYASGNQNFMFHYGYDNPNYKPYLRINYSFDFIDLDIINIDSPTVLSMGANQVTITLKNNGIDTIPQQDVYLRYRVDNGIWNRDTLRLTKNLYLSELVQFTFNKPWQVSTGDSFELCVQIFPQLTGDPDNLDKLCETKRKGKQGTFSIGPVSGDFPTFLSAINFLKYHGVGGKIIFNVEDTVFNERVYLTGIEGLKNENEIIFKGHGYNSLILFGPVNTTAISTIVFDNASYITFDSFRIQSVSFGRANNIAILNNSHDIMIKNCIIQNTGSNNTGYGILMASNENILGSGDGYNLKILNNRFLNLQNAIHLIGLNSKPSYCHDFHITNNQFHDIKSYCIYANYLKSVNFRSNRITSDLRKSAWAFSSYYCIGSNISDNLVLSGSGFSSLRFENINTNDSSIIVNNIYTNGKDSLPLTRGVKGIYTQNSSNIKIVHNTISLTPLMTNICLDINSSYNITILNNIFENQGKNSLVDIKNGSNINLDHNNYFSFHTLSRAFCTNNICYNNLKGWQKLQFPNLTSGHDLNSTDQIIIFDSTAPLHLLNTQMPITGMDVGIITDVDGDPRCTFSPSIGADESKYIYPAPNAFIISEDTVCSISHTHFYYPNQLKKDERLYWYYKDTLRSNDVFYYHAFQKKYGPDSIQLILGNCTTADTAIKVVYIDTAKKHPETDFICAKNFIGLNEKINLFDLSSDCPETWHWVIFPKYQDINDSVVPTYQLVNSNLSSPNPELYFTLPGEYDVCLITSNSYGPDTACKKKYLHVSSELTMCHNLKEDIYNTARTGFVYDDGGPYNDYNNLRNCELLIHPCYDTIAFVLDYFETLNNDYLKIFDGQNANNRIPIWDTATYQNGIWGDMNLTGFQDSFVSTSGYLFLNWITNFSSTKPGFVGRWHGIGEIKDPIQVSVDIPDTACVNSPVHFSCNTGDKNPKFKWDIYGNDSTYYYSRAFYHIYATKGNYTVKLMASSCGGDTIITKQIYVIEPNQAPRADFSIDHTKPILNITEVGIRDNSIGCTNGWDWRIFPANYHLTEGSPYSKNIKARFYRTGCFDVQLISSYNNYADTLYRKCAIEVIDYCKPQITSLNHDLGMNTVKIGNYTKYSAIGVVGYNDYTSDTAFVEKNMYVPIKLQRHTSFNAIEWKVWIDWNSNGIFDQSELAVYQPNFTGKVYKDSIRIPNHINNELIRMRVSASIANQNHDPCIVRSYGETEDYTLYIVTDITPPVLTLIGQDTVYLPQCYPSNYFIDSGVVAYDNVDGNISSRIKISGNIDFNQPGTYWISYNVSDSSGNKAQEVKRTIIVLADTFGPEIILSGNVNDTFPVGMPYTDAGYIAYDSCVGLFSDTSISSVNSYKTGQYTVEYRATDNNGNISVKYRNVFIIDTIPPVVNLIGRPIDSILVNHYYPDKGLDISDNYCGDFNVKITTNLDTTKLGIYYIDYEVTDCQNNGPVTISRIVHVIDTIPPYVSHPDVDPFDTLFVRVFKNVDLDKFRIIENYKEADVTRSGNFLIHFPNGQTDSTGTFNLTFDLMDSAGNAASYTYYINVYDDEPPVITIYGPEIVNLLRWHQYPDSFSVIDNYDNNVQVVRSGTYIDDYLVNYSDGFFVITYDATDSDGNKAVSKERYVNILDNISVEEMGHDRLSIYPNPFKNSFIVQASDHMIPENILIYDALGREIKNIKNTDARQLFEIDLGNHDPGMYLIRIKMNDEETRVLKVNKM